jgi:NAD-dependent SIR2 family protein deacetylase
MPKFIDLLDNAVLCNREQIESAKEIACFHCGYKPTIDEIEWCPKDDMTAHCPKCDNHTLIPDPHPGFLMWAHVVTTTRPMEIVLVHSSN